MLKNILNLEGVEKLNKNQQQGVQGGHGGKITQFECEVCLCGVWLPSGVCLHPSNGCA